MDQINTAVLDERETNAKFLTVNEMAKSLSIARVTAYQLTKTKDFPCFYIGKRIIIPLHSFNEWINKQAQSQSTLLEVR
jgi:excisionase family DNA binding protein